MITIKIMNFILKKYFMCYMKSRMTVRIYEIWIKDFILEFYKSLNKVSIMCRI
jgi:hypothetical protein